MNHALTKTRRLIWRTSRNLVFALPGGQRLLFPPTQLAQRFGSADTAYALHVYRHHRRQLLAAGFTGATRLLETGPGRNLGTALLWWCAMKGEARSNAQVTLWDVHAADPAQVGFWRVLANDLQEALASDGDATGDFTADQRRLLAEVAAGHLEPDIRYLVCRLDDLARDLAGQQFDLLYSHAALEHVREIDRYWALVGQFTARAGWHSHRIDLADHGLRGSNYIEMLEWSPLAWWLTMRFIPGAINRWRANEHLEAFGAAILQVLQARRELRPHLPIPRNWLAEPYRSMDDAELRTTAIDLVGRKG